MANQDASESKSSASARSLATGRAVAQFDCKFARRTGISFGGSLARSVSATHTLSAVRSERSCCLAVPAPYLIVLLNGAIAFGDREPGKIAR
jgi:hypothetical protein